MSGLSDRVARSVYVDSRKAFVASAIVMSRTATSVRPVTAAKAAELTVKELEKVQTVSGFLENVTIGTGEIMGLLPDVDKELMQKVRSGIGSAAAGLKKLPANVADQMNAREYQQVLGKLEAILQDIRDAGENFEHVPAQRDLKKCMKEMTRLHRLNPTMKKSKKGWYVALGAGTLAVALLAIGAYFLPPDVSGKIRNVVEDGMEFIERQGGRFLGALPDWLTSPIDSFMDLINGDVLERIDAMNLGGRIGRWAAKQPEDKLRMILDGVNPDRLDMALVWIGEWGTPLKDVSDIKLLAAIEEINSGGGLF